MPSRVQTYRKVKLTAMTTHLKRRTSNVSIAKAIFSALSRGSSGEVARHIQTASRGTKHLAALNVKPQEEQLANGNRADAPTAVNSTEARAKNRERRSQTGHVGRAEAHI